MSNILNATKRLLEANRPLVLGMVHLPALPGFIFKNTFVIKNAF
jgi:predicted TIM-barrel enzyme